MAEEEYVELNTITQFKTTYRIKRSMFSNESTLEDIENEFQNLVNNEEHDIHTDSKFLGEIVISANPILVRDSVNA